MARIIIIDTPQVMLWYHTEEKIVHHHIQKFIYGEEFSQLLLAGTELIQKYGAKKWLSNTEDNVLLRKEDLEWSRINWLPQTVAAGWKYWAVVQPKAVHVQLDLDLVVKSFMDAGVTTKYFINEDMAWQWLVSQP